MFSFLFGPIILNLPHSPHLTLPFFFFLLSFLSSRTFSLNFLYFFYPCLNFFYINNIHYFEKKEEKKNLTVATAPARTLIVPSLAYQSVSRPIATASGHNVFSERNLLDGLRFVPQRFFALHYVGLVLP